MSFGEFKSPPIAGLSQKLLTCEGPFNLVVYFVHRCQSTGVLTTNGPELSDSVPKYGCPDSRSWESIAMLMTRDDGEPGRSNQREA